MKKLHYLCLGLALVLAACGKDDPNPPDDPTTNPPTIASFSPQQGTPGTTVEIIGTNFSTVKTENAVKFNGTSASVSIATATKLTVSVPNGATSGKIAVTVDGQTAQSSTDFTVTESSGNSLAIQDFSPMQGPIGTSVTINVTGISLSDYAFDDIVVKFNDIQTPVSQKSSSSVTVYVPTFATTGKISIEVGGETAVSDEDFTITVPWRRIADFPGILEGEGYRHGSVVATLMDGQGNTKIFAGLGGKGGLSNNKTDIWSYDVNNGSWVKELDFPGGPRRRAFSFVLDNKWYIGGGTNDVLETVNDFWVYNPIADSWTELDAPPVELGHRLTTFTINGKGYVFGVADDQNTFKSIGLYQYDPIGNMWDRKNDLSLSSINGFLDAAGFAINGKGYIVGGGIPGVYSEETWEYDPNNDTWTQKADFGGGKRVYLVGFSMNGMGYAGMGVDQNNDMYNDLWVFDPTDGASGSWTQKADLPDGFRQYSSAVATDSKAYFIFGFIIGGEPEQFWEYTPSSDN